MVKGSGESDGQKKIKVLIFMATSAMGGFEKMVYHLAKGMNHQLFDVSVCVMNHEEEIGRMLVKAGIKTYFLNSKSSTLFSVVVKFYQLMKRNRYDIIYLGGYKVNLIGRIIGKLWGAKVITAQRSVDDHRKRWQNLLEGAMSCLADLYISNSYAASEMLSLKRYISKKKIVTIHNGIDLENYVNNSLDKKLINIKNETIPVIGVVANFIPYKGHDYFIEAIKEIKNQFQSLDFYVVFVGDGKHRAVIEEQVQQLHLEDRVLFLGTRQDVPSILSCIDIFVLPSLFEGMPNAVMEAMASGKAIVATNVGGVPELITNNISGYIVPAKNSSAMAAKIAELLQDREKREVLGKNAYQRVVEHFSMESMIKKTEKTLMRLY